MNSIDYHVLFIVLIQRSMLFTVLYDRQV